KKVLNFTRDTPNISLSNMALSVLDVAASPSASRSWQEIVDGCDDAWIWHTWAAREFNLCAAGQFEVRDLSFFVCQDDKVVGVVPLVVQKNQAGKVDAIYYSGILPWPAFRAVDPT